MPAGRYRPLKTQLTAVFFIANPEQTVQSALSFMMAVITRQFMHIPADKIQPVNTGAEISATHTVAFAHNLSGIPGNEIIFQGQNNLFTVYRGYINK